MGLTLIKKMSGHSGCKILLYKDERSEGYKDLERNDSYSITGSNIEDGLFVRKMSGDISYNRRLKKQFLKQKKFFLSNVKTPKILNYGMDKDLFFFDMEFLVCTTLAQSIKSIKIKEINALMQLLFESLEIKNSSMVGDADKIFKKKILNLNNEILQKTEIEEKVVQKLISFDFSTIPCSNCCGDLTLENVLISDNGQIYLIDFLDSFYNSWMIDVAKLLQDLEVKWSFRNEEIDFNCNMRLLVAKEMLLENIMELDKGQEKIIQIYHILLLNLLRIIPYALDEKTLNFTRASLEKVFDIIVDMEAKL